MWLIGIVLAAMLVATFRLTGRYAYGPRSRRLVALDLVLALALGLLVARLAASTSVVVYFLVAAGTSLAIFVFSALATAEVLRKRRQRSFDVAIDKLGRREAALESRLESIDREHRALSREWDRSKSAGHSRRAVETDHRSKVERWKQAGGGARIRSIKISEWEDEFRRLDAGELDRRRREIEVLLETTVDAERRAQLEAMSALAAMVAGTCGNGSQAPGPLDAGFEASSLARQRREVEVELETVRQDLAEARQRLRDFLSKEIRLE